MPPPVYSRQQLQQAAAQDAQKYGVGPWFANQISQESGFNPNARSGSGAEGIAQFMPGTAKSVGLGDPYNPIAALDAAAKFDAQLLKRYGTPERALSAYNSGRPDAYKDPNFAKGQTYNYVRSILGGHTAPASQPNPINTLEGQHAAAPPALVAAAAPPPHDYRGQLATQLAAAAGTPGNDLSAFYSTLHKALQARDQAAAPTVAAPQPGHLAQPMPGRPVQPLPAGHGQIVGNTSGEQPQFVNALAQLAAFEHKPVEINSGYRSTQKQAQLYANRASNPNPVAAPGHSLHEQGLAADGTVGGVPLGTLPDSVLARFGLETVPGDPVHVQVRRK